MKKILLFLALLLLFKVEGRAQYQFFQEKTNIVVFSGLVDRLESRQLAGYAGLYLDATILRSRDGHWLFGAFGQISGSQNKDPSLKMKTSDYEFGGGVFLGNYNPDFSPNFQSFFGFSSGLIMQKDRFEKQEGANNFSSFQGDLFFRNEINLNFLKRNEDDKWFHRTQLQVRYKKAIKTDKDAFWNDEKIEATPWNKDYLEVILKENIFRDKLKNVTYWTPKIVGYYSHAWGDSRSFYGLGVETSLYKIFRDDFLSLGILFKGSHRFTDNYIIISLNLNLNSLIRRKGSKDFKVKTYH